MPLTIMLIVFVPANRPSNARKPADYRATPKQDAAESTLSQGPLPQVVGPSHLPIWPCPINQHFLHVL